MPQINNTTGDEKSASHLARRLSYPLRRLTSDAIAAQAVVSFGGTLAGAGTGAMIFGASMSIFTKNRKWRAASISIGALVGGTVGSTLGGVSGVATGLFVGMVRLPFAIARSIKEPDPAQLITPLEKTVKGSWVLLNNPGKVKEILLVKYGTYFSGQSRLLDKDAA